ncbi:MAG: hypothetical protein QOF57_1308 [Frankiaceae bacterium]|jgi:hypothetical protein|nr:hypothetical protein [Frankiaceae bacterium]
MCLSAADIPVISAYRLAGECPTSPSASALRSKTYAHQATETPSHRRHPLTRPAAPESR